MAVWLVTGGVAWGQSAPVGLAWDANTESDLAGYRVYQSTSPNVPVDQDHQLAVCAPSETNFNFQAPFTDGQYYWVVTAFDTANNESGPSNEVTYTFDSTPPVPPTGCSLVY